MDFVSAVKTVRAKTGETKAFYGMLCDFGAFEEEERWTKGIVKQICEDGYVTKLLQSPSTTEIADMMYKFTNQYGYDKNNVSLVFHKLALGLGVVKESFDWDNEFSTFSSGSSTKKQNCPQCGMPYYKSYSAYCYNCGKKR